MNRLKQNIGVVCGWISVCVCDCRAAGAGRWDGVHAGPASEQRRCFRERPGPLRGVCLSQREALPVQGRGHFHVQWESGVLKKRSISHAHIPGWKMQNCLDFFKLFLFHSGSTFCTPVKKRLQRHDGIHGFTAFIYTQLASVPNTSESFVDISQSRLGNEELVAAYILCNMFIVVQ